MKILIVTNMYPAPDRPSYGSFIKTQVDSLIAKGMDLEVFVIRGDLGKTNYLRAIFALRKRCAENKYDLVHAHYGLSGLVAQMQSAAPVLVSFCGDDLYGHADHQGQPTRPSLFLVWLHKRLALKVAGVIVKSRAMKELLPTGAVKVIPNGVEFDHFKPLDKPECRQKLELGRDTRYVLFPYNPKRLRKNYATVQKAVEQLNSEQDYTTEVLVVSGQPNSMLPVYMNAADVLVLASCWEGSPNAIKEALACNLPIVSADVGDVRELISGLSGCALCAPEAPDIAAKLAWVLSGQKNDQGRAAVEHLRLEKVADRVIAEYQRILGSSSN